MNFLAHLFLSHEDEGLLVGNFLGDFTRNKELADYPRRVRQGVWLHRAIDSYTDNHPLVITGMRRLYERHHKYAPVLIDIFYDHLLSHNWSDFADIPLPDFTRKVYGILERHQQLMPGFLQRRLSLMIADDWLLLYGKVEGLEFTFRQLKKRVSRPEFLDGAVDSLLLDFELYDREFRTFFPDVIDFVRSELETISPD